MDQDGLIAALNGPTLVLADGIESSADAPVGPACNGARRPPSLRRSAADAYFELRR
jgi:hypothetical protein